MSAPVASEPEVVLIGAGVLGLFTAHALAQRMDPSRILVLDRGYLSAGASGRNGGGVRQQWEDPITVRWAKEGVRVYRRFARDFGFNPWFRQGGYCFLAFSEEERARLRRMEGVVRGEGLPIRWLEADALQERVPRLDPPGLLGGTELSSDGVIYPFPVLWGLRASLLRLGVQIRTRTEVVGIDRDAKGVQGVRTREGRIPVRRVVNVAGGASRSVSALAGLRVPNVPSRHEILATEAVKPLFDPMVVTLRRGSYFSQSMRGEIIGGLAPERAEPAGEGLPSSSRFLHDASAELTELFPSLARLRVLRSWAGLYDETPDGFPILGEDPRLPGFFQGNGFGGHGFMLAPAGAPRLAALVLGESTDLDPGKFGPGRFSSPGASPREGLVLG